MLKFNHVTRPKFNRVAAVLVIILLGLSSLPVRTVQAGSGATIDIPASDITPTLDGKCDPSEYGDAAQVIVTVGASHSFPVFMKHTATDAYFCFGDNTTGLPLPAGTVTPSVALYIDRSNDGITIPNDSDDFGIWMSYDPATPPWSNSWGTNTYDVPVLSGWDAKKNQVANTFWQAEFKVSSLTMGGWNHKVGLALFYHWWQFQNDDYSWPANGIWANPQLWGNANLTIARVTVGSSATIPVMDGQCGAEYSDASTITFNSPAGPVTGYLKHSLTDLYVCLANLAIPAVGLQAQPNAALYIDRTGTPGGSPTPDDLLFTISYTGVVQASSGDGSGFTGPDPGGYTVMTTSGGGVWNAEFRISSATIGKWLARTIDLTAAEQNVVIASDSFGWPAGYSRLIPSTWGQASLIDLGTQSYLPLVKK